MCAWTHIWRPIALAAASVIGVATSPAQIVISARAGLLNYTDGCVLLDGKHLESQRARLKHLVPEQRLRTEDGNAEVMLGPAVFLRLGFESEMEMVSTDLEAPQVRLLAGSALIDANGLSGRTPVSILVGDNEVRLVKKGLYRLDIPHEGPEALSVWDGRAVIVGQSREKTIREGFATELAANVKSIAPSRAMRVKSDALDQWSRRRADAISDANAELLRKQLDEDHNDKNFGLPRLGRGLPGP